MGIIPREHLGLNKPLLSSQLCPSIPTDMYRNEDSELRRWKEIKVGNYRIPILQELQRSGAPAHSGSTLGLLHISVEGERWRLPRILGGSSKL
jgi:hypothetical protein